MHAHVSFCDRVAGGEMEAMTVSTRIQQTDMHDFFLPARAEADASPAAGAEAD